MKICLVAQTFKPQDEGGAEIFSRHMAVNLSHSHEVVVLALGMAGVPGAEPGECETDGAYRVYRVPFHNAYLPEAKRPSVHRLTKVLWHAKSGWGAVRASDVRAFFAEEKFDVIYAQNCSRMQPVLCETAAEMGIPVCQHLHDYALLCPRTSMYRNGKNCTRPCMDCSLLTSRARSAARSVNTVIAVSDFVRQRVLTHGLFTSADFHVLHNTIMPRGGLDQSLLASRPPPEPGFTFGYLGALSTEKGVDVMLDAFCALPADLPARLLIAGRGHPEFVAAMQAKSAAQAPGRIEWLGFVKPEQVYARAEVILIPSLWHEPQSLILIEAATYGVPVIAARNGGSPEIVEGYGTGWCYDSGDVGALNALMLDAATGGGADWRDRQKGLFPGLAVFEGTAEATRYYARVEQILNAAVLG